MTGKLTKPTDFFYLKIYILGTTELFNESTQMRLRESRSRVEALLLCEDEGGGCSTEIRDILSEERDGDALVAPRRW